MHLRLSCRCAPYLHVSLHVHDACLCRSNKQSTKTGAEFEKTTSLGEPRLQATKYSRLHPAFAIYEVVEPQAEIFLAAAWMFRMTGDELYKAEASARHAQVRARLSRCS